MLKSRLFGYLVAFSAIGLIIGFVSYRAIANPTEQNWQPLSELVSPAKLTEIVAESTAPSADREMIAASAIGYQQNDLLLVDFNTPTLCGVGGCALAGYQTSTGQRILAVYVQRTSTDEPIVEAIEQAGFALPCLLVPPVPDENSIFQTMDKDTLCYKDGSWSIQ
jgi:hypothetical protein